MIKLDNKNLKDISHLNNIYSNTNSKNNKNIHILLFYKFHTIENPEYFARKQKSFCKKLGIFGKILIAKEGINGSISGTKEQTEKYKKFLRNQKGFGDVKFKEETGFGHPFTKTHTRIRNEIVSLKKKIDINKRGKYLTPKEFLKLYENNEIANYNLNENDSIRKDGEEINHNNKKIIVNKIGKGKKIINNKFDQANKVNQIKNKDQKRETKNHNNYKLLDNKINSLTNKNDFIVLDARNYYEYNLGRFKKAINPNIKTFREFPRFVEKFKKDKENKKKKIVMYCTGGIRCEKASAYMIKNGFKNVYQLEGGIINFCQQFPNTVWEGKCFVFDKRLMTDINQNNKPISRCVNCHQFCDLYRNCKNVECDKLIIMCVRCQEKLQGCCSEKCLIEFIKYARKRAVLKKLGKWEAKEVLQSYVW